MSYDLLWSFRAKEGISPAMAAVQKSVAAAKAGMNSAEAGINSAFKKMGAEAKAFQLKHANAISDVTNEIPGASRALSLLSNPYVMAGAAAVAAGAVMYKATEAAAEFDHNFKKIRLLNLGAHTKAELNQLKGELLDMSKDTGLGTNELITGYFDIQSITGKYGDEVKSIIKTAGEFAEATDSDVNATIAGMGKAMKDFKGLAADDFLKSNFAAFRTAKVEMNELAQHQATFLGAVSSSGQTIDEGNKAFAAFTVTTRNSRVAAEVTKTAFEALGDADFAKAMKALDVQMYDAHKNILPLDRVVENMIPAFKKMNDQQFGAVIKAIGGNEGIKMLLEQTRANGEGLLDTFRQFDDAKKNVDMSAILRENANDLEHLKKVAENEYKDAMIDLGTNTMPLATGAMKLLSSTIKGVSLMFSDGATAAKKFWYYSTHGGANTAIDYDTFKKREEFDGAMKDAKSTKDKLNLVFGDDNGLTAGEKVRKGSELMAQLQKEQSHNTDVKEFQTLLGTLKTEKEKMAALNKADVFLNDNEWDSFYDQIKNKKSTTAKITDKTGNPLAQNFVDKEFGKDGGSTGGRGGGGFGGSENRNITVNIAKLVEKIEVTISNGAGLSSAKIKQHVEEALIGAVRDSELMLAQ